MNKKNLRVHEVPGYLLHATSWRETSLIIHVFTRDYGYLAMVAKGAKRPQSVLRPVLNAFQPLSLSWTGAGELKTLTRAESAGILGFYGRAYMLGWYMNELVLSLLAKEDPHPKLFMAYDTALKQIASLDKSSQNEINLLSALRRFEWILLQETGYGIDAEPPDFDNPVEVRRIRQVLRERLDQVLEQPLRTRQVMRELYL